MQSTGTAKVLSNEARIMSVLAGIKRPVNGPVWVPYLVESTRLTTAQARNAVARLVWFGAVEVTREGFVLKTAP